MADPNGALWIGICIGLFLVLVMALMLWLG
jgi:hypothetical protein